MHPHVQVLMDTRNQVRLDGWRQSDSDGDEFFEETIIDTDDHWVETTGECKEGIGLAYNGTWDYPGYFTSVRWFARRDGLLDLV